MFPAYGIGGGGSLALGKSADTVWDIAQLFHRAWVASFLWRSSEIQTNFTTLVVSHSFLEPSNDPLSVLHTCLGALLEILGRDK